ncbi:hypothetical protein TELCIR_20245 [Teladorsagia circumcincta]|uniref:Uncharacterized protein n=1 Tax=Teladorsagia circumcincta TaxID=45464 RepID=A0A2G9TLH2_TELCI|nr:hypothetical protein TELCIR_20245 [Teladorsagia circumcincta]
MPRWACGWSRLDKVRNEDFRGMDVYKGTAGSPYGKRWTSKQATTRSSKEHVIKKDLTEVRPRQKTL